MTNGKKRIIDAWKLVHGSLVTLCLILIVFALSGCSGMDHESKYIEDEKEEEQIEYEDVAPLILIKKEKIEGSGGIEQYIFYDPETMVMYTHYSSANKDEGMHEMHNADGTLRIYDGKSDVKILTFICKVTIEDASIDEYVFFDPETLVMFVHYTNIYDRGLSEMHNADGTLRTYNPKQ